MRSVREPQRGRNQRVSNSRHRRQQYLLDVRVRARTATQHRTRRVLVLIAKCVLAITACVGVYVGGRVGLQRLFFDNPDYRLGQITVQTDGTLQREQVIKTADLREGANIFSINLATVHDRLQQLPQIDDVVVERNLPGEINIRITERKPVAWITSEKTVSDPFASDAAFLIDARGVLMRQKKLLPEYLGLPLITGCSGESLVEGRTIDSFEAKAALELLRLSTRSFMQTRFQVREIDVSKGYCLVVTDKNHARVTFGFDDLETQLQRLEHFLVYTDEQKQELETVNLLVQRNTPVTFAKPAAQVINETIDPAEPVLKLTKPVPKAIAVTPVQKELPPKETPRVEKAKPVAPAPAASSRDAPTTGSGGVLLQRFNSDPLPVRKAAPAQKPRRTNE